jgi:hypothetical protein
MEFQAFLKLLIKLTLFGKKSILPLVSLRDTKISRYRESPCVRKRRELERARKGKKLH